MAKPTSPFANKTRTAVEIFPPVTGSVAQTPAVMNRLVPMQTLRTSTAITKSDVDMLGSDLQVTIGRTSTKIIESMNTAKFGDVGNILIQVQNTAEKLDPNKQFGGMTGWLRSKFVDVKSYLRKEFTSAGAVFDQLVTDLTKHIAMHDQWIKNLDLIFDENHQNYQNLNNLISKADTWKAALEQQFNGLPVIQPDDPDALMKAQDRSDMQSLINRVDMKIDTFKRLKQICENNAPKIRGQQKTSEMNKTVLRDIIDFTIPTLKMEFSLYLNSLDSQKTQQLIQNTRVLAQQTMVKSADAAADAAISASKNLNAPMLDNPTLDHLRDKILFTVSEVKRIESEAATQRQTDAISMKQSTQKFIQDLTNS